ncbi:hypothetical protein DL764_007743 [Monosporascus ibericus]|uniref:Uncharacterized protein n=1 Tax=Monosporascus ibericus TaxID=155417 RepID=A0A4Q4T1F9_9PEZI|nr:hypothetical protein DL764_007743 [Monosporascus ibericus]
MYAIFGRTKAPPGALCASCMLLSTGGEDALIPPRRSGMSRPTFADPDDCSCNTEGRGSGPPRCYTEQIARREFWYAKSGNDVAGEEVEYEDANAENAEEYQGKKRSDCGRGIFKLGGILRRDDDAGRDNATTTNINNNNDNMPEDEAEKYDDAPAPLFLRPNSFLPGVLSVDGEVSPTTTRGREHGTIPSILIRRVQYTPPTLRPRGFDESSVPLPSLGLLSPPVPTLGALERSPFVVTAAKMGNRGLARRGWNRG